MAVESVMIPQLSNGEETANENEPGSSAQGPARKNKGKINPWNAFLMQMRSKGVKDVKTIRMLYRNLSSEELTQLKQWSEQFNRGEECPLLQPETIEPRQIGCPNTGEVLYTCPSKECGRVCESKARARQHMKSCPFANNTAYSCKICYQIFSCELKLKKHIAKAHRNFLDKAPKGTRRGNEPYAAELQSSNDVLIMDNFESFNKDHNSDVKISLAGYVECKSCPKLFESVEARDRHYKKVHEAIALKRHYECPICGKSFYNNLSFKRHKRLAHKNNMEEELQKPIDEDGETNAVYGVFQCEDCNENVTSIGGIKRHYKMKHSKNLEIQELMELQISTSADDLGGSLCNVHLGSFECEECHKSYKSHYRLMKHLFSAHQIVLPGYDVNKMNPKVKMECKKRARKVDCLLCTKQFLTRIALLNHYHHIHKIRQNSLPNISKVKQSIQNIQQALANKDESVNSELSPKKSKTSAVKVSPKRSSSDQQRKSDPIHIESSTNSVHQNLTPSSTTHPVRTAIPASMIPDGITDSSVVYLKQSIGKTQVSAVPMETVILTNQNADSILANQNTDSVADVTEIEVSNTVDVRNDDVVSKTISSECNYEGLPFNESNTNIAINGLDDLLTFDSADADDGKIECDCVCKICFKVFSDWTNLQTHYSCIHKLNVRSHVS